MQLNLLGYLIIGLIIIIVIRIYQEKDNFQLKCVISNLDGNTYCVRDREKLNIAADRLATISKNLTLVVESCKEKYPEKEQVKRLSKNFNPKKIVEILPTSKYTAYSENKGEKMAFCLETEKENGELIDENTLTYVALHELAHIATEEIGHTDKFWENFKFLILQAKEINVYEPVDYKKQPIKYCGMKITDNPYFDLK